LEKREKRAGCTGCVDAGKRRGGKITKEKKEMIRLYSLMENKLRRAAALQRRKKKGGVASVGIL